MRIFITTVLIAISFTSISTARCETFSYKSTPLYSAIEKFKTNNPEFSCAEERGIGICTSTNSTYGGHATNEIKAEFYGNKLASIHITFNDLYIAFLRAYTKELIDGLTRKLGKPTITKDKELDDLAQKLGGKAGMARWEKNGDFLELVAWETKESSLNKHSIVIQISCKDYNELSSKAWKGYRQKDL